MAGEPSSLMVSAMEMGERRTEEASAANDIAEAPGTRTDQASQTLGSTVPI